MKEVQEQAIKDLKQFYIEYIEEGLTEQIKEQAIILENKYFNTNSLITKELMSIIDALTNFHTDIGEKIPTKEEAEQILNKLQSINL